MISQKIKIVLEGIFLILISTIIGACSAKMIDGTKLNLNIEVLKSNAWINLMPGINMKPTFHFNGEIKIKNTSEDLVKDLKLQEIDFYTDSTLLFKFIPVFKNKMDDSVNTISPLGESYFTFNSPKGLVIKSELVPQKFCNALLKFSSEGKTFEYKIDNIKVEKVY